MDRKSPVARTRRRKTLLAAFQTDGARILAGLFGGPAQAPDKGHDDVLLGPGENAEGEHRSSEAMYWPILMATQTAMTAAARTTPATNSVVVIVSFLLE